MWAVLFKAKEARSGIDGHSIVTEAGTLCVVSKMDDGYVTSQTIGSDELLPAAAVTWRTAAQAHRFMKGWGGHPWYSVPASYEVVPVKRRSARLRKTLGYVLAEEVTR